MTTRKYLKKHVKDPDEVLDYGIDWNGPAAEGGPWLESGDVLESSTWTADDGITIQSSSFSDTQTTVWVSGGTAGEQYELENDVVTAGGRTASRTILIICEER